MRVITMGFTVAGVLLVLWGLVRGLLYSPPQYYSDTGVYPMWMLVAELAKPIVLIVSGWALLFAGRVTSLLIPAERGTER
ncbi:hypothetical protein [Nonomuraea cavernae]|uniref:hypothetical protein n=1 Tax=Nonomuraea cavernae TaxID=2045107 RepID=UPI003406CE75